MTACPTNEACKVVKGKTIHRLFDANPIDFSYGYKKVKELKDSGIKYIFIDEVSFIEERMWGVLSQIKAIFNFVFVGFGEFAQLKPRNTDHIDFKNCWIVKYVFSHTLCELEIIHRFKDSELTQDVIASSKGYDINIDKYDKVEHDFALCWTNKAVDAINEKWNIYHCPTDYIIVNGANESKFRLYIGLPILAYRSFGKKIYNSDDFKVKYYDKST